MSKQVKTKYYSLEQDPKFKKAFWKWFDTLSKKEKEKFWYFSVDMATTYYYNKYYSQMRV